MYYVLARMIRILLLRKGIVAQTHLQVIIIRLYLYLNMFTTLRCIETNAADMIQSESTTTAASAKWLIVFGLRACE